MVGWSTPKPVLARRWGGHGEGLRRRRGDAAGVELGASLTDRLRGERGNHPLVALPPGSRCGGGQVRRRLMAVGWGGGPVVVRSDDPPEAGRAGHMAKGASKSAAE